MPPCNTCKVIPPRLPKVCVFRTRSTNPLRFLLMSQFYFDSRVSLIQFYFDVEFSISFVFWYHISIDSFDFEFRKYKSWSPYHRILTTHEQHHWSWRIVIGGPHTVILISALHMNEIFHDSRIMKYANVVSSLKYSTFISNIFYVSS